MNRALLLFPLLLMGCPSASLLRVPDGAASPTEGREELAGIILVVDPPEAEVAVDGVTQGKASDFDGTVRGLRMPAGIHDLRLTAPGRHPVNTQVWASVDGVQRLTYTLERR